MFCQKPYGIYYFIYNMQLPSFLLEQYGFAVWGGGEILQIWLLGQYTVV